MNADRIATLTAWQEAAGIERKALVEAQSQIDALITDRDAEEYPRSTAIADEIRSIDRSALEMLVSWQEDVRKDRDALIEARDALPDDSENERFSTLTREIAKVDEEILARLEEIETLATIVSA